MMDRKGVGVCFCQFAHVLDADVEVFGCFPNGQCELFTNRNVLLLHDVYLVSVDLLFEGCRHFLVSVRKIMHQYYHASVI